jgi:hypothetical protein
MSNSILESTKKVLNLSPDHDVFDQDLILHINSVLSTLNQLGIGPEQGFMIEDDTIEWAAFLGSDLRLNNVKTYVYLRVRLLFDPPTSSAAIDAIKSQISELEWRLNTQREDEQWTPPIVVPTLPEE